MREARLHWAREVQFVEWPGVSVHHAHTRSLHDCPSTVGGGDAPDPGAAAAIAAGNLMHSRLEGATMFSPNKTHLSAGLHAAYFLVPALEAPGPLGSGDSGGRRHRPGRL